MCGIDKRLQNQSYYRLPLAGWLLIVGSLLITAVVANVHASTHKLSIDGYLDHSYDSLDKRGPTAENAESKLWWNDGYWWGSLYNDSAQEYQIYRLDWLTQTWESSGVALDNRKDSSADILWDQTTRKLYVASHYRTENPRPRIYPQDWAYLYRYSYDTANQSYRLDSGFPTVINRDRTETLVLDKDSTGRLWVA